MSVLTDDPPETPKSRLRVALRDFVAATFDDDEFDVYPSWPDTLRAASAFVAPQQPYTDETTENGGTFQAPAVLLRIVIVAPPFGWEHRHDFLDYWSDLLSAQLRQTDRIGEFNAPRVRNTEIAPIGGTAKLLAANLNLTPVVTRTEPSLT